MTRKTDGLTTGKMNRRDFVKTGAGAAAAVAATSSIPSKVFGQTMKEVTFTQSWIPNGGSMWIYVAMEKGMFKKRGIDVKVSRGFGSVASAQAVGQGKFDFGISAAPAAYLQVVKGMELAHLACCSYSSLMGVGYLRDSGIKTPKDLEGKKMGSVVKSGEFPFLPAFAERTGFDWSKVDVVQVDNKIRTGVLLSKQVDCISCFASSVAPDVATKGYDVGWFLYKNYDMPFYGYMLITQPEMYAKDKGLCEAMVDANMEGIMYTMLNPEESLEIFLKHVPEAGLTPTKKKALTLETGLFAHVNNTREVANHGMGSIEMAQYEKMTDLIMTYVAKGDKKPDMAPMLHLDYVNDKFKFSDAELAKIGEYAKDYAKVVS